MKLSPYQAANSIGSDKVKYGYLYYIIHSATEELLKLADRYSSERNRYSIYSSPSVYRSGVTEDVVVRDKALDDAESKLMEMINICQGIQTIVWTFAEDIQVLREVGQLKDKLVQHSSSVDLIPLNDILDGKV